MAVQKQDDKHEHTFSSYVRIRDAVLKTYLGRWTIGGSGERGSGISVLPARHDDDDLHVKVIQQFQMINFNVHLFVIKLFQIIFFNERLYVIQHLNYFEYCASFRDFSL